MPRTDTIEERLEEAAYKVTDNFCYGCYVVVQGDHCPHCESDDFMRHMEGVGVEYGTDWVIEELIRQHCEPIDTEELFEQMLDDCYEEITLGCLSWSPSYVMKELDPTAYRCGVSEYIDGLVEDGEYYEFDGGYYDFVDIEEMLDNIE
ncbi:MAG: hypothetical protein FVQ82_06025 [Planctomycetes bacterium]|nr:hypothetical protein [Planctomycetota bacterium]